MKPRGTVRKHRPRNDEDSPRYLGNRDDIENLLCFCNMTEVSSGIHAQVSPQPQQEINSVLVEAKELPKR